MPPRRVRPKPNCSLLSAATPLGFAHRGGAALWPENTLEAFERSQQLGPFVIETDAHVSRDGRLVLSHDARLDRTTNARGPVSQRTADELAQLDAGYWFTGESSPETLSPGQASASAPWPWRGKGLGVPSLERLLERLPAASLNIELKPGCANAPEAMWRLLERTGNADRCLIASADHALAQQFRKLCGGLVATSASRQEVLEFAARAKAGAWWGFRPEYQALQIPTQAFGVRLMTPRLLQIAHDFGLVVHVWTINDPRRMRELVQMGADGVMTDRPDLLAKLLWPTETTG